MRELNRVFLLGNLTRDPELRFLPNKVAVANLRLAINRTYKKEDGETKKETCFINVVTWAKQAETCQAYLHKGSLILVEGILQSRSWETQKGEKRNTIEVLARQINFMDNKKETKANRTVFEEEIDSGKEQEDPLKNKEIPF